TADFVLALAAIRAAILWCDHEESGLRVTAHLVQRCRIRESNGATRTRAAAAVDDHGRSASRRTDGRQDQCLDAQALRGIRDALEPAFRESFDLGVVCGRDREEGRLRQLLERG